MFSLQVTIRDIPSSDALESHIRKKIEKLAQFHDRMESCKVVVEWQQKHKHQGKLFNVRINLSLPRKKLITTKKCDEDVYVALRDAFNAIERQLEDHVDKRQKHVKVHDGVLHGHIVRILPKEGYGFIEGHDGNQYYFSTTNVTHPEFSQLLIGDAVQYVGEPLNEGWLAHHIVRERNHSHAH